MLLFQITCCSFKCTCMYHSSLLCCKLYIYITSSQEYQPAWCTWARRFGVRDLEWRAGQDDQNHQIVTPSSGLEASQKCLLWVRMSVNVTCNAIQCKNTGPCDVSDVWNGGSEVTGWSSVDLLSWFLHGQHVQLQEHHTAPDSITGQSLCWGQIADLFCNHVTKVSWSSRYLWTMAIGVLLKQL